MRAGDLVIFAWPTPQSNVDDPLDWERARIGMIIEVLLRRPEDRKFGDELLVLHDGERWSVPATWCRPVRENP